MEDQAQELVVAVREAEQRLISADAELLERLSELKRAVGNVDAAELLWGPTYDRAGEGNRLQMQIRRWGGPSKQPRRFVEHARSEHA